MAERRMFSKSIIDSDLFLDMPASSQLLYFHLGMRADDDGFINNPKRIIRMVGASEDDLKILIAKEFIIPFETGIIAIRHWKIHNYIRSDRYKPSTCDEKSLIRLDENMVYQMDTNGIPDDVPLVSIGKVRLGKDRLELGYIDSGASTAESSSRASSKKKKIFVKPTVEEVRAYCISRKNNVDPEQFVDFYESNGWHVGKNLMKDWKAAVRNWERNDYSSSQKGTGQEIPKCENSDAYKSFVENL